MALQFLSKEWFEQVMALRTEAEALLGAEGIPAGVREVRLNITVPHADGDRHFAVKDGDAQIGHIDDAHTRLTVDYDVARRLIIEGDPSAGVQAFMAGQIRVDGDLSKLLVLQQHMTAPQTPEQRALRQKVVDFTSF